MQVFGQPVSRGVALAAGVLAGAALTVPMRHYLPSAEQEQREKDAGRDLESFDDALATVGSLAFVGSAGIAAGLARRATGATSVPLLLLGAAGMFTSLAGTTLVKSESEGRSHIVSLGLLTGVAGLAYVVGASGRVPKGVAQNVALASLGVFAGAAGLETARWVGDEVSLLRDSVRWKRENS